MTESSCAREVQVERVRRPFVSHPESHFAAAGGLLGLLLLLAETAASWFWGRMLVAEFYWKSLYLYPLAGASLGLLAATAMRVGPGRRGQRSTVFKGLPVFFLWIQGSLMHLSVAGDVAGAVLLGEVLWLSSCLLAGYLWRRLRWRPFPLHLLYAACAFGLAWSWTRRDLTVTGTPPAAQVVLEGLCLVALSAFCVLVGQRSKRSSPAATAQAGIGAATTAIILAGALVPWLFRFPVVSQARAAGDGKGQSRPNVVVVVVDTLRADHLSSYGYGRITSPNLDDFAAQGTLYRKAFSPANWTLPAHASLFTGRFPRSHGAHRSGLGSERADVYPLADGEVTLAEVLNARGYRTGAVVANHLWVRRRYGLAQGFDDWYAKPPSGAHLLTRVGRLIQTQSSQHRLSLVSEFAWRYQRHPVRQAPEVNRMALQWLDQKAGRGRFLLFLNYMDVHSPRRPPAPFRDLYPGRLEEAGDVKAAVRQGTREISAALRRHFDSQYDGSIAYWDHHFGHLLASMRQRGLLDDTLFVITSDHGEYLGEHGLIEHEIGVGDEMTHVPLIIRWPHTETTRVVDEPVQLTDLLPTVLDLLGLTSHPAVQGSSLPRQPRNGGTPGSRPSSAQETRPVYLQHYAEHRIARWFQGRFRFDQRALRLGDWTLVLSRDGRQRLLPTDGQASQDADFSDRFPQVAEELLRRLRQFESRCPPAPKRKRSVSPEAEEALRSLGYL